MAEPITNELIYEVLKRIQSDVAHIRDRVDDHDQQFILLRREVHNLRGDGLDLAGGQVAIRDEISRLKNRFEFADTE